VSGGGFLKYDQASQEYAGLLQLKFTNLELQAFGLITTKVANGAGYSVLALVDAEFPPVQLGWGFTLNGVGGLLAVNRTASVDALHAALKAGQLSSVLFPKNAIPDSATVLAQLDAFFPTAAGRFLFGPMANIGWGTPTLLTAALAVIIELPEPIRILLLARVEARLPSPSNALVSINMDALGVLDLSKSSLAIDATLFDSRLVGFTLSGQMALRAYWSSDRREFLLAIGGFSPRFNPPADFPTLERIVLDMPDGIVSKLHLAAYLAITSNTLQVGAALDVFVGVSGFGLSGHLGFDALFQFEPFHFDGDISGSVAIEAFGDDFASVSLDGTLSGPAPWYIAGKFKLDLLLFTAHKSFSHGWGTDAPAQQIAPVDISQLLAAAILDARNWAARFNGAFVSTRRIESTSVVAHPLAQLEVLERIVPLGLEITRFGAAEIAGAHRFDMGGLVIGASGVTYELVQDDFAPAQFFDLTDDEKLARPSFERHDSGLRSTTGLVANGSAVVKQITYETFYVDSPGGPAVLNPGAPVGPFPLADLVAVLGIGAAGRIAARGYDAPGNPVHVAEPAFALVDAATLAPQGATTPKATYSDIHALWRSLAPEQRAKAIIVGQHELKVA
jgi:hypothetical protein